MGLAASYIARLLQRYRWIAYVGLAIILYVALKMIYEGFLEVSPLVNGAVGCSRTAGPFDLARSAQSPIDGGDAGRHRA